MGKRKSAISGSGASGGGEGVSGGGGGGIMGSGMHFGVGTGVVCKSTDNSYYCSFVKIVNTIMMMLMVAFIVYLVVVFVAYIRGGGKIGLFGKKG